MRDNVVDFTAYRRNRLPTVDENDILYCPCGSSGWVLEAGTVNITLDMRIVGWTGAPVCNACNRPMGSRSS